MDLANAIPILVSRPLFFRVIDGLMAAIPLAFDARITCGLIGRNSGVGSGSFPDALVKFFLRGRRDDLQIDPVGRATDHARDRGTIVLEGPKPRALIGAFSWRIAGIGMANPFLTSILIHLVSLDVVPLDGAGGESAQGLLLGRGGGVQEDAVD